MPILKNFKPTVGYRKQTVTYNAILFSQSPQTWFIQRRISSGFIFGILIDKITECFQPQFLATTC